MRLIIDVDAYGIGGVLPANLKDVIEYLEQALAPDVICEAPSGTNLQFEGVKITVTEP